MNKKLLILLLLAAISCSKKEQKGSAELSYVEAHKLLQKKDYAEAANEFEKIDDEYPFSKWAAKGQAMAVYARYKNEDYAKLVATVDDFIRLNPSSSLVPYMLYMKGLTYYNQIPDIRRAQDNTQQASYIFREIIARFPATRLTRKISCLLSTSICLGQKCQSVEVKLNRGITWGRY